MTPAEAALAIAVAVLTVALAFAGLLLWALWGALGHAFDDLADMQVERDQARTERDLANERARAVEDLHRIAVDLGYQDALRAKAQRSGGIDDPCPCGEDTIAGCASRPGLRHCPGAHTGHGARP